MTYHIPNAHYDGQRHVVPFTIGADFIAKREAYAADGFTYAIMGDALHVCKVMAGEDLPKYA